MGGLGQERRDPTRSIPARESVQVQPGVDRNSAATQRDRLTPVQPVERTDPDPFGVRGTGLTFLPTRPTGAHTLSDDSLLHQALSLRKPLHVGHPPLEFVLSCFVRFGVRLHVIQTNTGSRPAPIIHGPPRVGLASR